jgi:hypothetical protein
MATLRIHGKRMVNQRDRLQIRHLNTEEFMPLHTIDGIAPDELDVTWLGLKLNDDHKREFQDRLYALVNEFKERGPDPDGATYSLFATLHPDRNPPGPG